MFNTIRKWFQKPVKNYVYIIHYDGCRKRVRVVKEGLCYYGRTHSALSDTVFTLFPNGKIQGPCYVKAWEPATDETTLYFFSDFKQNVIIKMEELGFK